jgi:hypothetical protein
MESHRALDDDELQAVDRCTLPRTQIDLLISANPPVWLVSNDLVSAKDRSAFLDNLESEVENSNLNSWQECKVIQIAL